MSQQPEALRPADVLDEYRLFADNYRHDSLVLAMVAEIERLRAELEALRKQEPVEYVFDWPDGGKMPRLSQPAPSVPAEYVTDATHGKVMDAIAGALGDAYDCLRVWEAWSYGTMSQDDFVQVVEQQDRLAEIADAAISAMLAALRNQ